MNKLDNNDFNGYVARDGHSFAVSNQNNRCLETFLILDAAIEELTERQQKSLKYFLMGYPKKQIAIKVGCSKPTVDSDLKKAIDLIKRSFCD